ncbi:hypothetical protein, partial [Garicola koreensis]|uniref:hypothetical protein n=1 Tax=Garicola koreensis TaxID=1262554 RepID=UPI001C8504F0
MENRKDFIPTTVERAVSMDHDLKRQPLMDSMTAEEVPLPDGSVWEMATFSTALWETVEECLRLRHRSPDQDLVADCPDEPGHGPPPGAGHDPDPGRPFPQRARAAG